MTISWLPFGRLRHERDIALQQSFAMPGYFHIWTRADGWSKPIWGLANAEAEYARVKARQQDTKQAEGS